MTPVSQQSSEIVFITLTTCSNHVEQGRFVVVAKEVESGDTYLPLEEEVE